MPGKVLIEVMDKEKIPHLLFYCISFGVIAYLYGIKVAFVLALLLLTVWAYSNLISDILFKAKGVNSKEETRNKNLLISTSAAIIMTVLGALFFNKTNWGYVVGLTAIVFLPAMLCKLKN